MWDLLEKNLTCQSQIYFFFICELIRRIIASAQTCPCELNGEIKPDPAVETERAEIRVRSISHPLSSIFIAQGLGGVKETEDSGI